MEDQMVSDEFFRIIYAAYDNNIYMLKIMNLRRWKVNSYDYDGRTPLGVAASEGHLEACRYLINHGANPN